MPIQQKPKPTPMPAISLPLVSFPSNRALHPIVRSVYESLALNDVAAAERYLRAHLER